MEADEFDHFSGISFCFYQFARAETIILDASRALN
jgi:hypothetical protein